MNDAGKVAFTPKGDYSSTVTYEYLDTVVYNGNAYAALKTTTGNAPTDSDTDENWRLLARGGTSVPVAKEETTGVVKASSDIGVSDDGSMILETDYTSQESLAELTSGESRTTFFGKIAKAVSTLISHITTSATSSVLGHVKLTNSVSSTSTSTAAVPASVKKAYDLANMAVPTANISQSSAITETGTYVLDAVEKNASVEGTMAHDIAELNSNLTGIDKQSTVLFDKTGSNKIAPTSTYIEIPLNDVVTNYRFIVFDVYTDMSIHGRRCITLPMIAIMNDFPVIIENEQSYTLPFSIVFTPANNGVLLYLLEKNPVNCRILGVK